VEELSVINLSSGNVEVVLGENIHYNIFASWALQVIDLIKFYVQAHEEKARELKTRSGEVVIVQQRVQEIVRPNPYSC
jgi:hypothetical protein